MKRKFFIVSIILLAAGYTAAQVKTVTNADLEKFRQKRLAAEKEYRDNYKRLGLPSPEELARRREADKIENERLAARYENERIERERGEAAAQQYAAQALWLNSQQQYAVPQIYDNGGYLSYGWSGRVRPRVRTTPGYFAGGAFWPTPGGNARPVFIRPPRPRH